MVRVRTTALLLALTVALASANLNTNCLPPLPPLPPLQTPPANALYSVQLDHYGPEPKELPPINAPHVVAPTQHEPLKVLPHPPIPPPKLISHKIVHFKTYQKPQVYQRIITVPKVFRFLRKGVHPVIEHIPYQAKPILPEIEPPTPILGLNSLKPQSPLNPPKLSSPSLPVLPKLSWPALIPQFVC